MVSYDHRRNIRTEVRQCCCLLSSQNPLRLVVALGGSTICRLIEISSEWPVRAAQCGRQSAEVKSCLTRMVPLNAIGIATVLVMLLCTGCRSSTKVPRAERPTAKTPVSLMPGDVVKLTFAAASDLNQSQKIRTDGKLSLPLIGEVTAAGKTIVDFQTELIRLYKPHLRDSAVVVTLEGGIGQVVVSGAVVKPAKFTFDRPTSVFQAIMEAGGVNEFGSLKKVRLIRIIKGRQQSQVLDLRPALTGKNIEAYYVKDGDVIYVPQAVF